MIPEKATPIEIPYRFRCRPYQNEAWRALKSGKNRAVLCWHRGCGKDLFALNWLIYLALRKPCVCIHAFPNFNQGKRAIWKSIHDDDIGGALSYLDHIPKEVIKHKNSTEMTIELTNGSIYCVMGIDGKNAARARGMNPTHVILSEYAFMDASSWQTVEPRVKQNKGTVIFISTPNGKNHFYELYNHAAHDSKNYYASKLTIDDTKTLSDEDVDQMRREGWPEDFLQQELYCSFDMGSQGSYYGKLIQKARDDNRIINLVTHVDHPIHTAWDIGIGDNTAIWFFQRMTNGSIHFIHYYQNEGESLEHYLKYLNEYKKQNDIEYGKHFVPHDMLNRDFTTGVSRINTARDFGYVMQSLPKMRIEEGIQAARSIIPVSYFDIDECAYGIKCLEFYRKRYNEGLKVYYDEPCHDKWSDGADAFRYAAIGIKSIGLTDSTSIDDYAAINNYFRV